MNIIFLDIDGVLLPTRAYLGIDGAPQYFDPYGVDAIKRLVKHFDPCRIVFNTTWNLDLHRLEKFVRNSSMSDMKFDSRKKSISNDIDTTCYPHGIPRKFSEFHTDSDRLLAIKIWCDRHTEEGFEETNWVAFDDANLNHKRHVRVNKNLGITVNDYVKATEILGSREEMIILI